MRQIKLNRQKLGVEDLLFGTGTEEQTRGNQQAIVTKINACNLPFDETRSLSEFAQQVNLEQLGNSITELLNINTNLSTFLTVVDNLGILTIIEESITNLNSLYTNLQAILDVNTNESNINSVNANESNINTLASSITNLNSLYTNLQAILDVNDNESNINAVNANETNINAVNANESNINTIVTNLNALLTIFDNLSGLLNIDPYQFNKIGFKTNVNETVSIGQVAWNQQESTIDVGLNSEVTLQVGQEELVLVKNVTGTTINNGKVVMVVGSNGNSGNLLVALHDGTKAKAVPTLGITTQDIANDTSGFVTKSGKVRGINTSGSTVGETWVDGDVLYVSTNGNLTKVVPSDTALKMAIAVVINAHGSNGTLFVRTNGLDENHDKDYVDTKVTKVTSTDNAIVRFNGTTGDVQNSGVIIDDSGKMTITYSDSSYLDGLRICNTANSALSQAKLYVMNNNNDYVSLIRNSTALGGHSIIYSTGNSPLVFDINGAERMRIDANGNLLVGTTTDNGVDKLQINGNLSYKTPSGRIVGTILANAYITDTNSHTLTTGGANSPLMLEIVNVNSGVTCIPIYPYGGSGIKFIWNVLNPATGAFVNNVSIQNISFTVTEKGNYPNTYIITLFGGSSTITIQATTLNAYFTAYLTVM